MSIPIKAVWLAVHRIFSDERVDTGCTLPLKDLMVAWCRTGMRMRDLAEGLETLSHTGHLSIEMSPEGPRARLLNEQFGLAEFSSQDRSAVATVQALRNERRRPTHLGSLLGAGEGRRAEDRYLTAHAA